MTYILRSILNRSELALGLVGQHTAVKIESVTMSIGIGNG